MQRKRLSLQALNRSEPIARLAGRGGVSRKFVYEQTAKASAALDEAFAPVCGGDREVLFHVPGTKDWLHQFVLAQVLIGHSSFRGVIEILDAVFDYRGVSIGTVHNIVREAVGKARAAEADAITLARDIRALADWMKNDVLSLAGPDAATRQSLFDFIVAELHCREALCPHRIRPVRRMPGNHRDDLLAFAGILDQRFADIARQRNVPSYLVHGLCQLQGLDPNQPAYWERQTPLRQKLRHHFHAVQTAVRHAMAETPRASSIVENLNSRLRSYSFLRRHIGDDYLELLRFFLNHRRFLRSDRLRRVGKSPAELLNGQGHPHWLELLGFQRFHRN